MMFQWLRLELFWERICLLRHIDLLPVEASGRIGNICASVLLRRVSLIEDVKDGSHEVHEILHGLQVDLCSTVDIHVLQGHSCISWSAPQTTGESLLWCLKHLLHPLPLLFNWPWCLQSFFFHVLSPFSELLCSFFRLFLDMLSQGLCHHHWWFQPWPAVNLSWSQLSLAPSDTGEASGRSSGKLPP